MHWTRIGQFFSWPEWHSVNIDRMPPHTEYDQTHIFDFGESRADEFVQAQCMGLNGAWSSLVEGDEDLHLSDCQANLNTVHDRLSTYF